MNIKAGTIPARLITLVLLLLLFYPLARLQA